MQSDDLKYQTFMHNSQLLFCNKIFEKKLFFILQPMPFIESNVNPTTQRNHRLKTSSGSSAKTRRLANGSDWLLVMVTTVAMSFSARHRWVEWEEIVDQRGTLSRNIFEYLNERFWACDNRTETCQQDFCRFHFQNCLILGSSSDSLSSRFVLWHWEANLRLEKCGKELQIEE